MGFCGQAAAGLRECVERPERRTGRVIKVAAPSPSLVWPLESLMESGSANQSGGVTNIDGLRVAVRKN